MSATDFDGIAASITALITNVVMPIGLVVVGVVVAIAGIKMAVRMARGV